MYKFKNNSFDDFYFGDKKLSEFGGYVGSSDGGLKQYSLLPSREYTTEKPLGTHITTVYASSFEPRTFSVPVVFDQLDDGKIRELAMWLDSPSPKKFQWVGDTVYIEAFLDSTAFDIESSSGQDGQIDLKFIAFNPFWLDATQYNQTISGLTSAKEYEFTNSGYGELAPYLMITCSGTIKIEILDKDKTVYTTTNITDITGGVKINSETLECTLLSGASHFSKIDTFPMIPNGKFFIKVTGSSLTNMTVQYRQKYI